METQYITYKDGQVLRINAPYEQFKEFKKTFNTIVSDGFSAVYQTMVPEINIVSKMRFEFDESVGYNIVDNDTIGRLAYMHQEVISQITGNTSPTDLTCFVMTHPQSEMNGKYFEEVYFEFPYLKAAVAALVEKVLPNFRIFLNGTGILDTMEVQPDNSIEEILSGDIYGTSLGLGVWPMPGSYIGGSLLTITHVFEGISKEQMKENQVTGFPPEAYFSNFQIPDGTEYDNSNSFFFANLNGFEMVKKKKNQREKNRDVATRLIEERQKEVKRSQAELCKIFLDMLSPDRFANEVSRNKIGQVLFNVLKSGEEGLELWKDSIQYKLEVLNNSFPTLQQAAIQLGVEPELIENGTYKIALQLDDVVLEQAIDAINKQCEEQWQYMEYTECTIGTLRYWANMDNPDQYKAFVQKDVITLAWKCLNATSSHTDVAKLVYAKYSNQFACANIKDNLWFGYWNHRWHELDTGHSLRIKLSEELPPIFEKLLNECTAEYRKAIGDEDKEKWSKLTSACAKMIKELKTVAFKNNIIKECAEKFYDEDFVQKLDEDRCLLGLPNGVYELETDTFRPGKPEDFLTLSTKAKYNPNYSWDHPKIKEVTYYMKTVYPDVELRHYVQKIFGTILEGGNMNKDFYNMIGEGDNSKSMIAKVLKLALGKYISKIPVAMIMGKRGKADNATPHMADKKGVRALFVKEPPKGQSNVSVVKELSGNDDILSRALFKMPVIFSPQWKLFVFTNHLLEAPAEEKAYWNRQKVIDHESTFSFDAPYTQEEQFKSKVFPRDPLFDRKL